MTQALSASAMLTAVAFACTTGAARRGLIVYAGVNAAVYAIVAFAGVMRPSRTLLSFEVLMLFALPGILLVIGIAGHRYRRARAAMERSLLAAALGLLGVQAAYFGYAAAGFTQRLWEGGRGFYFSENDVLHIGMIGWLAYVFTRLGPQLRDASDGGA